MLEQFQTCTPVMTLFRPRQSVRPVNASLAILTGETADQGLSLVEVSVAMVLRMLGNRHQENQGGDGFLC
jgi:hypothetical protein